MSTTTYYDAAVDGSNLILSPLLYSRKIAEAWKAKWALDLVVEVS